MPEDNPQWLSFRELDEAEHCPKGTAFRAFKRLGEALTEDRDFLLLRAQSHGPDIESLRAQGRIYPASMNVVLLSREAAERVRADMHDS
ncbi:hypothetical protein VCB98_08445 [Gammaproteobacteria bacterium AB-CW1]|uniref:Uncharacterized protein n=1 Tax=Natronospira elongata TaxID=3110268 RepID=A0AAP6MLF6_9GAMM|nr:hypothetical protein [Gammaproteobacteria bacterium AB-CW1]